MKADFTGIWCNPNPHGVKIRCLLDSCLGNDRVPAFHILETYDFTTGVKRVNSFVPYSDHRVAGKKHVLVNLLVLKDSFMPAAAPNHSRVMNLTLEILASVLRIDSVVVNHPVGYNVRKAVRVNVAQIGGGGGCASAVAVCGRGPNPIKRGVSLKPPVVALILGKQYVTHLPVC